MTVVLAKPSTHTQSRITVHKETIKRTRTQHHSPQRKGQLHYSQSTAEPIYAHNTAHDGIRMIPQSYQEFGFQKNQQYERQKTVDSTRFIPNVSGPSFIFMFPCDTVEKEHVCLSAYVCNITTSSGIGWPTGATVHLTTLTIPIICPHSCTPVRFAVVRIHRFTQRFTGCL